MLVDRLPIYPVNLRCRSEERARALKQPRKESALAPKVEPLNGSVGGKCGDPAARNGPAKIAEETWYYWVNPRPRSRTFRQSLMSIAEFPHNQVVSGSATQNVSIIDLLNKIQPMCWNL